MKVYPVNNYREAFPQASKNDSFSPLFMAKEPLSIGTTNINKLGLLDLKFEQIQKKYLALKQKNCLRGLGSVTLFKRLARGKYIVLKNPSESDVSYEYMKVKYKSFGDDDLHILIKSKSKQVPEVIPIYKDSILKLSESWCGKNIRSFESCLNKKMKCEDGEFNLSELEYLLEFFDKNFNQIDTVMSERLEQIKNLNEKISSVFQKMLSFFSGMFKSLF